MTLDLDKIDRAVLALLSLGLQDPRVMKTVVRLNGNNAGVYGTVVQTGVIRAGDSVSLVPHG